MNITDVRINKSFDSESKVKARASITVDNCLAIHDIKVISHNDSLFISFPSRRMSDGTFKDIAHPINSETRETIQNAVLEAYNNMK